MNYPQQLDREMEAGQEEEEEEEAIMTEAAARGGLRELTAVKVNLEKTCRTISRDQEYRCMPPIKRRLRPAFPALNRK